VLAVAPPALTTQAAQLMDRVRLIGTGRAPSPPAAVQAERLGGKVVVAPNKLEDGMVVAYLTDRNGSLFALFSPRPEG
jgi:hypothetical protein